MDAYIFMYQGQSYALELTLERNKKKASILLQGLTGADVGRM